VLKGPSTAIILSVLLHLLLLTALRYGSINTPKEIKQTTQKITAIKSFLYQKPIKNALNTTATLNNPVLEAATTASTIKNPNSSMSKHKAPVNDVQKTIGKPTIKPLKEIKPIKPIINNTQAQASSLASNTLKPVVEASFSSYERLSRLREQLQKQQREQAFNQVIQQRSVSLMDGDPLPVPHTIVPLTREQQYQKNTSTSHVGAITKHDNGTCTIHRQQVLGSPVEASTSSFACGESKFDNNFRKHMQKVKNKLKPLSTND
jgi:hypothetical protein